MPSFVHTIDAVFHRLDLPLFVAAFIAWAVGVSGSWSGTKASRRRFFIGLFTFAVIIVGQLAVCASMARAALNEIRPMLSARVDSLQVNGQEPNNSAALVEAIRDMREVMAHHSSPTTCYRVSLQTSNGPLVLLLCRDSQNKHEYWVFDPIFKSANEVGRVFTDALDGL